MEKVFGYVRVSTETQASDGYGIQTQKTAIKDYCKENNLELVNIFVDRGISGTVIDRDGLTELLSSFNGICKVVVLNTSRLWRSDTAKVLIQKAIKSANADVISIEQKNYSIYHKDPNDFLINNMIELLDQYERLSINLKLAKGRKTKAKSGEKACGVAPLGYRWNSDAEIEVDPETACDVKHIYKKYLELGSIGKLKDYLDQNGYTTKRGNMYSKQALLNILTNDFYKGYVTHGSVHIKGNHKAIISPILFKQVESKLRANKKY
ncbi:MAG: recombinase family protein [Clostridia bacterium]|nr:recombinase family protein [Clostridia bacterium]